MGIFTFNIETIKSGIQSIKDSFTLVFEGISMVVTNVWNTITSSASLAFENIKTVVSNAVNGIKTIIDSIKTTFSNVFNSVKTTVTNVFNSIKSTISNVWNGIKSIIKAPHIVQNGTISIAGISTPIPKLGIQWYAKGGIMTRPTLLGVNGNDAMIGGEAGAEAVLPLSEFWNRLAVMVQPQPMPAAAGNTYNITVNVDGRDTDDDGIAEKVARRIVDLIDNM